MGVYIKGITVQMLRDATLEAVEELLESGEMVDVPEPHGRLIDENELRELIHRMWVAKQLTNTKHNTFNNLLGIAKPVIEAEGE